MIRRSCALATAVAAALAGSLEAAQFKTFGDVEVHYVVVNTTFLEPAIAEHYGLVRGRDRAFVNLSVVGPAGSLPAAAAGTITNLLGQMTALEFAEVREDPAVYYLAPFKFSDRETLRFSVRVELDDGTAHVVEFQETLYWEAR